MSRPEQTPSLDRRRVLGCAALLGLTGPLLVACSSGDGSDTTGSSGSTGGSGGDSGSGGGGGSDVLVATADVPVGGGVVLTDAQVVVTQPTEGTFKGFSSICTHAGNPLGSVSGGKITCPFHGSQFSVEDGSNVTGPNGSPGGSVDPLPDVPVTVEGDNVVRA